MSPVWPMTLTFLCLCYTAPLGAEKNKVVWRKVGEFITIQCKSSAPDQKCLAVKTGLLKEKQIFFTSFGSSSKKIISPDMLKRVQTHGDFPNVDILIKNLSVEDTGPYWCLYTKANVDSGVQDTSGQGSLLLVVSENPAERAVHTCESPPVNMVVVYIVGAAVVLLLVILSFVIWIIRRHSRPSVKPRRVATNNNDVYEDMRGTLRR